MTPGCLASSVVPSAERVAIAPKLEQSWRRATVEDLRGFFESLSIEGEAAASVRKLYYHFAADGSFSGAALLQQPDGSLEFATLRGGWTLESGRLQLDDSDPAQASVSAGQLKLDSSSGSVIFAPRAI